MPAVEVQGVTRRFGDTVALDGVDLEVAKGSVLGLLGPNGAGKTTLIRVLATLLRPDEGCARVFGHDVVREAGQVRELIGLTGQFAAVDEILSGRENLRMFGRLFGLGPAEARRRGDELLERFDLAGAADRPVKTYSGGMRRRLDLASSLLTRPRVLFLDEPTTGLDPRSRNQIWDAARDLVREGTTLVLTTQYLEEADVLADSIAVVSHGRVIARGTGDELKDQVGGATVQVRLAPGASRERALEVMAAVRGEPPQVGPGDDLVAVPADAGDVGLVNAVARALGEASVPVSELALRRPTLDDVFLQLTGEHVDADESAADGDGRGSDPAAPGRATDGSARDGGPAGASVVAGADPAAAGFGAVPAGPGPDGSSNGRPRSRDRAAESHPAIDHHRTPITPAAIARGLTDCLVVAGRNLRHFMRQPQLLLFSTVQPVMFVVLFAFVFGGAIGGALPPGVDYVDFLLPGIFIQSTAFRATQTASGLAEDLRRGVIDRFRSMPMARAAVLVGRSVADLVRSVFVVLLMVGVGYLIGFRFSEGPLEAVGAVAVVALFGFSLSWIFALIALSVKGQEAVQSAGFIAIFPLVFASSVFVPVETMPGWLEAFASVSPITLSADAARVLAIGSGDLGSVWRALAWCAGLLAIFLPLSVWRYSRMT